MSAPSMPGYGDAATWGPVTSRQDPRYREEDEQEERDFRREEPEFPEDDYDYERWDR